MEYDLYVDENGDQIYSKLREEELIKLITKVRNNKEDLIDILKKELEMDFNIETSSSPKKKKKKAKRDKADKADKADKRDKRQLKEDMRWDICEYPKGNNKNYDCVDIEMKAQQELGFF
mgnify:CR=1 FL=1